MTLTRRILLLCVFVASAGLLYRSEVVQQWYRPTIDVPPTSAKAGAWALETVAGTYYNFHQLARAESSRLNRSYDRMSTKYKTIGSKLGYPEKLKKLDASELANAKITSAIADMAIETLSLNRTEIAHTKHGQVFRVRESLQHFMRDWSEDGRAERTKIFDPVLDVLRQVPEAERGGKRVLVPGSGLARMAWDISQLGFNATANELSWFMNLALRFLLHPATTTETLVHSVQPWSHRFSHQRTTDDLFRVVRFPDSLPRLTETFSVEEGDFLARTGQYDYIVTVFFIDTSANVAATLEKIHSLLKPGGIWINLGPLLWAGGGQVGFELSLDEVMQMADMVGFDVYAGDGPSRRRSIGCEYTQDNLAMFQRVYRAEFWTAQKR